MKMSRLLTTVATLVLGSQSLFAQTGMRPAAPREASPAAAATSQPVDPQLASLRRATAVLSDPKAVVERYRRFIEQYRGTAVAEAAKADLAVWQRRVDEGLVKVGDEWLTPAERDALRAGVDARLDEVDALLRAGQFADARAKAEAALAVDAEHVGMLRRHGVAAYLSGDVPAARKSLELANKLAPSDAPTLNNLAVVLMRQKQYGLAVNTYERAMLAMPSHRYILDNFAEAWQVIPDDQKNSRALQRVAARYQRQDAELFERMKAHGLYRLGSAWVPAEVIANFKEAERKVKDQLAELEKRLADEASRVRDIDATIAENERERRRLAAYGRDITVQSPGSVVDYHPIRASELDRERERLTADRARAVERVNAVRREGEAVYRTLPKPAFRGEQSMLDPDGAPYQGGSGSTTRAIKSLDDPAAATTAPVSATQPVATTAPADHTIFSAAAATQPTAAAPDPVPTGATTAPDAGAPKSSPRPSPWQTAPGR